MPSYRQAIIANLSRVAKHIIFQFTMPPARPCRNTALHSDNRFCPHYIVRRDQNLLLRVFRPDTRALLRNWTHLNISTITPRLSCCSPFAGYEASGGAMCSFDLSLFYHTIRNLSSLFANSNQFLTFSLKCSNSLVVNHNVALLKCQQVLTALMRDSPCRL